MKNTISVGEFNKKVEIEFCYLVYAEYMKRDFAWGKARENVSKSFEVQQ
ncbi:hypothetical protein GW796_08910 [archaeon]|nr:hypothetical protein [archaeon]NCQ51998.1 hypothetical protein [archaeon]